MDRARERSSSIVLACGLLCALGANARELANVDALATAPVLAQTKAQQELPAAVQRLSREETLGVPSFVWFKPQAVSAKSALARDIVSSARMQLKSVASLYGMSAAEVDAAPVASTQQLDGGARLVRFANQRDGIDVFREQATVLLNAQGQALNIGGYLGSTQLANTTLSKSAVSGGWSADSAIALALKDFDFDAGIAQSLIEPNAPQSSAGSGYRWRTLPAGITGGKGAVLESPVRFKPVWFRLPEGLVSAFYIEIQVAEGSDHSAYSYVISRDDGRVLLRKNLVAHATPTPFSYRVWSDPVTGMPMPGPQRRDGAPYPHASPDGYAVTLQPSNVSTLSSGPISTGDPWLADGATTTNGNNVQAFGDWSAAFAPVGLATTTSPATFDRTYDVSLSPTASADQRAASVTSVFYLVNWMHDWFYDAGFDEASGNAQKSNYGRGGEENDAINAIAISQDGYNNANMMTPADGLSPTMRMYVFTGPNGPHRSGALDNAIVTHEWGHYISNRLIGNGNGLMSNQSGGLGEGWGDFHALMMQVTFSDRGASGTDFLGTYGSGLYAVGGSSEPNASYFGARRYPYSKDLAKNPLTFRQIQDSASAVTSNAPLNPDGGTNVPNSEVHRTGEVWASMLWQCYGNILSASATDDASFNAAQDRMKKYLVASYKLSPINPTFLEARDALLSVVGASHHATDYASCQAGFTQRGAGPNALFTGSRWSENNEGVVEDFGVGGSLSLGNLQLSMTANGAQQCDADGVLDNGETGVVQVSVINPGTAPVAGAQLAMSSNLNGISFLDGVSIPLPTIAAGATHIANVRLRLANTLQPASAKISAALSYGGQQGAVPSRTIELNVSADITRSSKDSPQALPSPMTRYNVGQSWVVAQDSEGAYWHQTTSQARKSGDPTLITPWVLATSTSRAYLQWQLKASGASAPNGRVYIGVFETGEDLVTATNSGGATPLDLDLDLARFAGKHVRLVFDLTATGRETNTSEFSVKDIRFEGTDSTPFLEVKSNAKDCNALSVLSGAPQSVPTAQPFAQVLKAQLVDMAGAPVHQSGVAVTFTAPAVSSGNPATASFAGGASRFLGATDSNGIVQTGALTANAAQGRYAVVASSSGNAPLNFELRNTGAPVGGSGNNPLSLSGPNPQGAGNVVVNVTGAQTPLSTSAYFSRGVFERVGGAEAPAPAGREFPFGVTAFTLENVGAGNQVTFTVKYPSEVPANAEYWKYSPITPGGAAQWHSIAMTRIASDTVQLTLQDGGTGDGDMKNDGTITDPGGISVPTDTGSGPGIPPITPGNATPVPTLSNLGLILLAGLLGAMGARRRRSGI